MTSPNDNLVKTYKSRQNQVMLVRDSQSGKLSIVKIFKDEASWRTEQQYAAYLRQQNLSVPEITRIEPLTIYMHPIQGKTACELIEACEAAGQAVPEDKLQAIVRLLRDIYTTQLFRDNHLILGDNNWRNFVFSDLDHHVYRIDFESVRTGDITDEAGSLIAFLLTYEPVLTNIKCQAARLLFSLLCQQLCLKKSILAASVSNQLKVIDERRGTQHHHHAVKQLDLTAYGCR